MGEGTEEDQQKHGWIIFIMEDIKAQGMDIREATDKARERSTWRLLVRASSSANALRRRKLDLDN